VGDAVKEEMDQGADVGDAVEVVRDVVLSSAAPPSPDWCDLHDEMPELLCVDPKEEESPSLPVLSLDSEFNDDFEIIM
jgi:hypothetical protein